jgi:EmrB/QacA subfamily drug resistance transporter
MTVEQLHARRWWTLAVLSLSLVVVGLDNTILNVALPSVSQDLHADASALQWIIDAYILVFAGLLLTAGSLGDRFGHRRMLTSGLVVFGAGSVASALADSSAALITTRAVMGLGAAFIMPATLAVLTHVFPAEERGRAIGIWAAVAGLGIALGPIAGGWLLERFEWNAVFWVNVPIVVAALGLGRVLVPETRDPAAARLDLPGAVLSIAGLTVLVWAIIEAPERGWGDGATLAGFAVAAALLVAFARWERRTASPMLDLALLRERTFSSASVSIALVFFGLLGTLFLTTQYLQFVLGYDPFEAGLAMLPLVGGLIVAAPVAAKLDELAGTRVVVSAGLAIIAVGLLVLSGADADTAYVTYAAGLGVIGVGMATAMGPSTDAIMGSLPLAKSGIGSATNDTVREVGGAFGVAVLGSLLAGGYRGDMEAVTAPLPAAAASAAQDSIGAAAQLAASLPAPLGQRLTDAAELAFVGGMHTAVLVAAAVAGAGAVVAAIFMPARHAQAAAIGGGAGAAEPATA